MRAKLVFEKFSEDGDPIVDMGIGVYTHRNFNNKEDFIDFLIKVIPIILGTDKIPENILHTDGGVINKKMFQTIQDHLYKYYTVKNISIRNARCEAYWWPHMVATYLKSIGYTHKYIPPS
jgi:hypothetical protein